MADIKELNETEITETTLKLLGIEEAVISILVKYQYLPCKLKEFVKHTGAWIEDIKSLLFTASFSKDGVVGCGATGTKFEYIDDKIIGTSDAFAGHSIKTFFDASGNVLTQEIFSGDTPIHCLQKNFYEDSYLVRSEEPQMVYDEESGYTPTGNILVKLFEVADGKLLSLKQGFKDWAPENYMPYLDYIFKNDLLVGIIEHTDRGESVTLDIENNAHSDPTKHSINGQLLREFKYFYDGKGKLVKLYVTENVTAQDGEKAEECLLFSKGE